MDHAAEARKLLAKADYEDNVDRTELALTGIGHALLNVADAIREQTEALHLGGVRDDLGEIAHAVRSRNKA